MSKIKVEEYAGVRVHKLDVTDDELIALMTLCNMPLKIDNANCDQIAAAMIPYQSLKKKVQPLADRVLQERVTAQMANGGN